MQYVVTAPGVLCFPGLRWSEVPACSGAYEMLPGLRRRVGAFRRAFALSAGMSYPPHLSFHQ